MDFNENCILVFARKLLASQKILLCLFVKYFMYSVVEIQLHIVVHDAHFNQSANSQRDYHSKITRGKTSAIKNVRILCSNNPPPAATTTLKSVTTLQRLCQ